ncbi:MAG: DUF4893 domain-containing protein [Bauldia sp.]
MRLPTSLLLAALVAVPASSLAQTPPAEWVADKTWQAIVTPFDADRLLNMAETRAGALQEAAVAADFAEVVELADAPTAYSGLDDILGVWRCRTIKLGGLLPLTIYSYFACEIGRDANGYFIAKTTGSQRFTGRLYLGDMPGELVFVGAGHYTGEQPLAYDADPERNEVGVLRQLGPGWLVLELPKPIFESNHDLIEFVR